MAELERHAEDVVEEVDRAIGRLQVPGISSSPGEDFLQNAPDGLGLTFAADLRGRAAAISIEPNPDDDPGTPFLLKPLVGSIPADAETLVNYELDNQAGGFPTWIAVIR